MGRRETYRREGDPGSRERDTGSTKRWDRICHLEGPITGWPINPDVSERDDPTHWIKADDIMEVPQSLETCRDNGLV